VRKPFLLAATPVTAGQRPANLNRFSGAGTRLALVGLSPARSDPMHSRTARGAVTPPPPEFPSYEQAESVYLEWRERFGQRMHALLPSLRQESVARLAESWYPQADHLAPEDAAEIAATWWRPYR
jgi:hypothetical protein